MTFYQEREHKRLRTKQRYIEMTNQISGISSIVKTLTEHITRSRTNSEILLREENVKGRDDSKQYNIKYDVQI